MAAAVEGAYACLEVVHSTWTGYRFNLEQNTADNSSAGQVVVGPRLPMTDLMALDTVAVRLHDGSRTLGQGVGADADGPQWRGWRRSWLLSISSWSRVGGWRGGGSSCAMLLQSR